MKAAQITPGMALTLKPARREAYDLTAEPLLVLAVVPRRGYSVPWIKCRIGASDEGVFRPSDFQPAR